MRLASEAFYVKKSECPDGKSEDEWPQRLLHCAIDFDNFLQGRQETGQKSQEGLKEIDEES